MLFAPNFSMGIGPDREPARSWVSLYKVFEGAPRGSNMCRGLPAWFGLFSIAWRYGTAYPSQRPKRPRVEFDGTFVATPNPCGRPVIEHRRELVTAIRQVQRAGCSRRMLPDDRSAWRIAFHYFRTWRREGTWQMAQDALVGVKCRWKRGRLANQFRISAVLWVA